MEDAAEVHGRPFWSPGGPGGLGQEKR
jgi:hypothetical protein